MLASLSRASACVAIAAIAAITGCPAPTVPVARETTACGGLESTACGRARGLVAAATAYGDVKHELILDPSSSFAPGRGLERTASAWSATTTACAQPRTRAASSDAKIDATTIDFGYVGVAVDSVLVGADADLTPWLGVGGTASQHRLRIVAIAFVRDLDPQFFEATPDVTYGDAGCACGRATHFVGAVKTGGMLAYEMDVRAGEAHGRALDVLRARVAASDARITETRVGGLEVEGLEAALRGDPGAPRRALSFKVTTPVPVAYAVYPVADVCKLAFPEPEVTPAPVDFGDITYGTEGSRLLHIVNRAPFDLFAHYREKIIDVPAYATLDVEARWAPQGEAAGCESQSREESIVFTPRDTRAPITPQQRSVRVVERVRTGRASLAQRVHVDTGESRAPDYTKTNRDLACPADYVVAACRTENAQCGDGSACAQKGYALAATMSGNGCHFACTGPSALLPFTSNYCRFDAVAECRLRCAP
jgi:hypothetical protein